MYVERLLQINMAALACLATLLLGMGQRSTLAPLGMLVAAMVSVWVTDFKGYFRLSKTVADWAAIAALVLCLPAALRLETIAIVSAVANLLVLLQVIHLFRKKEVSVYWHLMRFSVLQVVVAALLTQEILFGAMLIVYLFTALGAMGLLFLYSERVRYHGAAEEPVPAAAPARWPLARQEAAFWTAPSGRAPLGREFFGRVFTIGLATLLISALVFLAVPRFGSGAFRGFGGLARPTVGFSPRMRLGELGKIIQNPEEVLRLQLSDATSGEPYPVNDGVYLRGAILTEYRRGEWRPPGESAAFLGSEAIPARQTVRQAPIRQAILIEPLDRHELFCVWPFTFLYEDERIRYDPVLQRLSRAPGLNRDRLSYELATTAFWNNRQATVVPCETWVDSRPLLQMPSEGGGNPLPGLTALARQWIDGSNIPSADRAARASALERRLRESGRFQYSLQGQARDRSLDPIEDFITNNPRGHCEYFATALCLMLRSQGIPARVVVGFHTDELNKVGGFFQVRQLHAHTWVEVYLAPAQVPEDVVRQRPSLLWLYGAWLRLDATPAAQESSGALSLLARIGGLFGQINFAWSNYILEMDRPRQRKTIYQPVADAVRKAVRTVTDPEWWQGLVRRVSEALGLQRWWNADRPWLAWQALGIVLLAGLLAILALGAAWWAYRRWLRPLLALGGRARRGQQAKVDFYRRFEALLARRGLVRRPSQTQREFAAHAARQLAEATGDAQLPALLLQLSEAFYRVRFGQLPLDEPRAAAVQQALVRVGEAVGGRQ